MKQDIFSGNDFFKTNELTEEGLLIKGRRIFVPQKGKRKSFWRYDPRAGDTESKVEKTKRKPGVIKSPEQKIGNNKK